MLARTPASFLPMTPTNLIILVDGGNKNDSINTFETVDPFPSLRSLSPNINYSLWKRDREEREREREIERERERRSESESERETERDRQTERQ